MRHVCVFPAGAQHDGMLKGSIQRSNRRINIIAATRRAEEGERQDLHSSQRANVPPRPGQNYSLGRLDLVQDIVFIHSSPFTKCHLFRLAAVRFKATEWILGALFLELFAMPLSARGESTGTLQDQGVVSQQRQIVWQPLIDLHSPVFTLKEIILGFSSAQFRG